MTNELQREIKTYEEKKAELLCQSEGQYVLISDSQVLGTFDDEIAAISDGYARVGNKPFLVKRIAAVDSPIEFASNSLGI